MAGSDQVRVRWVDSARGVAILLVCFYHSSTFLRRSDLVHPLLGTSIDVLRLVPMPLFFLLSGLFAQRAVDGTWRALARNRVLPMAWLFCLWVLLRWSYFSVVPQTSNPWETDGLRRLARMFYAPDVDYWFLLALAVVLVVAKLLRRVPTAALLVLTGVPAAVVLVGAVDLGSNMWNGVASFLVFFLLGLRGQQVVLRASAQVRLAPTLALAGGWGAAYFALAWAGLDEIAAVQVCLRLVGLLVVLAVLVHLGGFGPLRLLGQVTVPLYLTNALTIGGLVALLQPFTGSPALRAAELVLPFALVATATGTSLLLVTVTRRGPLRALLHTPAQLVALFDRLWPVAADGVVVLTSSSPVVDLREAEATEQRTQI